MHFENLPKVDFGDGKEFGNPARVNETNSQTTTVVTSVGSYTLSSMKSRAQMMSHHTVVFFFFSNIASFTRIFNKRQTEQN